MANVDNPNGFRCIGTLSGGEPQIVEVTLADSQTIAQGDALIFSNIGTAQTVQIAVYTSGVIAGVAAEAVTTSGSTDTILMYPADPDYIFEAQCSGTYASASHDFKCVDIEGTTGIMEVNENLSTYCVFQILGMVNNNKNEAGANARVYGRFVRSAYTPLGVTTAAVNGSGSTDLTTWCDTFNGANGADDEDPALALVFQLNGTLYYVPAFATI